MTEGLRRGPAILIRSVLGDVVEIELSGQFVLQLREVVRDHAAGYLDVGDLVREALRSELDKAHRRIASAIRWSKG
jgi:hypothetical protein